MPVWSFNAQGKEITEPNSDVVALYSASTGYDPSNPLTDQGGVEQDVLTYLLNTGAPIGDGTQRDKILGFVEVDIRQIDDVRRAIYDCGIAYVGFTVPKWLMACDEVPPVWDYQPNADNSDDGGHAVIISGYAPDGFDVISWGRKYFMTIAFFLKTMDEAYAVADRAWIAATGQTPAGLTLLEIESQMAALRLAA
jgi:hypothetical protein